MQWKRLSALLLALCMLFGLAACMDEQDAVSMIEAIQQYFLAALQGADQPVGRRLAHLFLLADRLEKLGALFLNDTLRALGKEYAAKRFGDLIQQP